MLSRITADIVVLLHLLWIIFLICGAFIGRRHKKIRMLHLGGLGFAMFIQVMGWYCPLTYLEVWLRHRGGTSGGYRGSFIAHYVQELVYIDVSPKVIIVATVFIVLVSGVIYLMNGLRLKKDNR